MFSIKEVMKTKLVTVHPEDDIYLAIRLMIKHNITGMPVVDDQGHMQGIVSEKDVLQLLTDDVQGKVEDFMSSEITSFDISDDLIEVCECLIKNAFRRVPILQEGKLVGIISRRDIIQYILEPFGEEK